MVKNNIFYQNFQECNMPELVSLMYSDELADWDVKVPKGFDTLYIHSTFGWIFVNDDGSNLVFSQPKLPKELQRVLIEEFSKLVDTGTLEENFTAIVNRIKLQLLLN